MKPDFKSIDITNIAVSSGVGTQAESTWVTPEQIPVKPFYTKQDLNGMQHLQYAAVLPPYFTWTL